MLDTEQRSYGDSWWSRWSPGLRFWGVLGGVVVLAGAAFLLFRDPLQRRYHSARAADYTEKAGKFYDEKQYPSAQLMLANALRHDRERAATWVELARTLKAQDNAAAVDALAAAADLAPEDPDIALLLLSDAVQLRHFEPARQRLPRWETRYASSPEHLLGMAAVLQMTGQETRAQDLLERALTLDPGAPPVKLALGGWLMRSGDPLRVQRGRAMIQEVRELPAWRPRATETLATALATREPNGALMLWRELQESDPGGWRFQLGAFDSRRAAGIAPDAGELETLWAGASNAMERIAVVDRAGQLGGLEQHQVFWERLTVEERQMPALFEHHMQTLTRLGAAKTAVQQADVRLAEVKGNAAQASQTWLLRALAELALGETQLFHYSLNGALDACADSPADALALARRLRGLGYDDESVPFLDVAARGSGPAQDLALRLQIERHQRRGDSAALLECVERQVKRDPQDRAALNNLAALLVLNRKQPQRALELAATLYQQTPEDENVADTYALALMENGQVDKALEVFALMKAESSPLVSVRLHHALAVARSGRTNEALALVAGLGTNGLLDAELRQLAELRAGRLAPDEP